MRPIRRTAIALTAALMLASAGSIGTRPTFASTYLTDVQIAALSLDAQTALFNPLRSTADAIGGLGQDPTSDVSSVFAGVKLDPNNDVVDLYLTDVTQAPHVLAEALLVDSTINTSLVRVHPAKYTRAALEAERDSLLAAADAVNPSLLNVTSAIVPSDGSALLVGATDLLEAGTYLPGYSSASNPAVTFFLDQPVVATGRYGDTAPFVGGDFITGTTNFAQCTAGIPAQDSKGGQFIISVAHCFSSGETVYTDNNATHKMGTVVGRVTHLDAVKISTSAIGDEWENTQLHGLKGTKRSDDGDWLCQDGYTSAYVCEIVVDHADTIWHPCEPNGTHCFRAKGVSGHQEDSWNVAVRRGDSGGLVFCQCEANNSHRQVRGIVSAGQHPVSNGYRELFFIQALDIEHYWGLTGLYNPN